jgi:exodeoxyribonuclease V alpha subunit
LIAPAEATSPLGRSGRDQPAWLPALAVALGEALPRLVGETPNPLLTELIVLLTAALERGELELPLAGPPPEGVTAQAWPDGHRQALETSRLGEAPAGPLVLEETMLSWRRWHERRNAVLAALLERAQPLDPLQPLDALQHLDPQPQGAGDGIAMGEGAAAKAPAGERLDPQQRQAVAAVLRQRLVLLQGGPGTGKTTTVARMLEAVLAQDPSSRIQLAAPTGKAAGRLRLATAGRYPCSTLHRLLASRGQHFARNRRHPLGLDLLVIDEVSMVDLELMAAVLDALPAAARLVLVGDPAQLAPIAPGALLLELQRPRLQAALGPSLVTISTTYRNDGAIAAVAAKLRNCPPGQDPLTSLLPHLQALSPTANLSWRQASPLQLPELLLQRLERHRQTLARLAQGCRPGAPAGWQALLAERDRLLVLSPLRRGRWGVEAIHRALLGPAASAGLANWPLGTPVLCCRNLPELGLANGDVGVLVGGMPGGMQGGSNGEMPEEGEQQLLFGDGDTPLWVHPAQLAGAVEPALALTVHKAQGSEAAELIVLLGGEHQDPRLLYTALTRARQQALLITASSARAAASS